MKRGSQLSRIKTRCTQNPLCAGSCIGSYLLFVRQHVIVLSNIVTLLKSYQKSWLKYSVQMNLKLLSQPTWSVKLNGISKSSQLIEIPNQFTQLFVTTINKFKSIVLYLVLMIFTLKKFLNEQSQQFLEEAIKICPLFESVFEKWSKKHSKLTKKFNPKTLNKIYQDICFKANREKPNFNILVDSLLEISPPYTFDLNKNKKIEQNGKMQQDDFLPPKHSKLPKLVTSQDSFSIIKNEEVQNNEINPIFSTERLHQMIQGVGIQHNVEVSDFQAFGFTQIKNTDFNFDKSVFGNSQYSGDVNRELKFEDYFCHDLRLGLEQGQSQQHHYIRSNNKDNKVAEQSQNMMMNSSRINITDQYLNWKMEGSEYNY